METPESSNILLFGSSGLVGRAIRRIAPADWSISAPSSKECDIADARAVESAFANARPSIVINAAGFTQVDAAEEQREVAERANRLGPANLAVSSARIGARLIHLSTDYVFDGTATTPYREDAVPNPISFYGRTKLHGEQAVLAVSLSSLVVRTQGVFGVGAHSLVSSMIQRSKKGEAVRVVNDQRGRPTYAMNLASTIVALAERGDITGVLHVADDGESTPYQIAIEVYRHFAREELVTPVRTGEFPTKAVRPAYSVLALDRLKGLGVQPRNWRDSLSEYLSGV